MVGKWATCKDRIAQWSHIQGVAMLVSCLLDGRGGWLLTGLGALRSHLAPPALIQRL
ncbi:hypothetical protein J6590_002577 [Homalodisca vitripennis]|nr:hypothetical protein J6590_002577 [Homalodisca vitripennis]